VCFLRRAGGQPPETPRDIYEPENADQVFGAGSVFSCTGGRWREASLIA
jgi:hypothetical protein